MDTSMLFDGANLTALTIRATAVMTLAALLAWTLRGRSAGSRHGLWTATFVLLLALPIAYLAAPRWEMAVLPAVETVETPVASAPTGPLAVIDGAPSEGAAGFAGSVVEPLSSPPIPEGATGRTLAPPPLSVILWLLWGLGAGIALISLYAAHLRFAGLRRHGRRVTDPVWLGQLDGLRTRVGVTGPVDLVVADCASPMTGGIREPVIVLPDVAREWGAEQRCVVLTHELIHVRRRDALRQLVGRAALALYWFHPLGWFASRQAAVSRELACDEEVLSLGTRPSEYASLLLDLSERSSRAAPAVLSLAMVQRSQLERRLMSILDPDPPKRSSFLTASAVVALAALGISVAVAQPVPALQEAPPRPHPAPVVAPEPVTAVAPAEPAAAPVVEVEPVSQAVPIAEAAPVVPLSVLEPTRVTAPEPAGPQARPEPVVSGVPLAPSRLPVLAVPPLPPQDAGCRMEGARGSYSGTLSTSDGQTRMSGTHNGDRVIQQYLDDLRICMRMHGDIEMSDDMTEIESMAPDSWIVIESEEDNTHRLTITGGSGGLEYEWNVNGRNQTFDADARAWRDAMVEVLGGYWQAARLRGEEAGLRGQIAGHMGEVAGIRGQIAGQHGEVAALRGELAAELGAVAALRGEMAGKRAQLARVERELRAAESDRQREALADDVTVLQHDLQEMQVLVEERERDARISELEREVDEVDVTAEVRELEEQLEAYDLEEKLADLEREIEELDADRRATEIEYRLQGAIDRLKELLRRM
jgi:beta-lactamase regulating signal transducer with metallopeptidase domain